LRYGERITVLGMRSAVVVNMISKGVMIEVVLPWGGGAPSGSGKGEASMVMVCGMRGVDGWVVADRLSVGGRGGRIVDYAGTVEELCLSSITSGIIGIGEGVCREGEIGLGSDGRGRVVHWSAAETGQGNGGVVWVVQEILLRREDVVERESLVVIYLPIGRETRGRMTRAGGGGLTMEFYKSTTTFARDAFRTGVGAVAGKVCDHTLVTSLLRSGGARRRGGTLAPVVWGTRGFL
jgi:hypothetical protein